MSYIAGESGVQTSKPRVIYTFVIDGVTYRYTGADQDVELGGETFIATAISHSEINKSPFAKDSDVMVTVPRTHEIAIALTLTGIAPDIATCLIERFHEGDTETRERHRGTITGVDLEGEHARIRVPSKSDDSMRTQLPILIAQPKCANQYGDAACQANVDFNKVTTTVSTDNGAGGLVVASVGGKPNAYYDRGRVAVDGKQRTIISQVGTTLVLDVGFNVDTTGMVIEIFVGCDQLPLTCRDKFSNIDHFAGQPLLPTENPTTYTWWRPDGFQVGV